MLATVPPLRNRTEDRKIDDPNSRPQRIYLVHRRLAIVTLVWWGLGIELAPGLHVALHEFLEHHHHDGDPTHDDDHGTPNPEHGQHSLAHKHIAILKQQPQPAVPPSTILTLLEITCRNHAPPPSRRPDRVRARGPPSHVQPFIDC